jgi:hypothetical protein
MNEQLILEYLSTLVVFLVGWILGYHAGASVDRKEDGK